MKCQDCGNSRAKLSQGDLHLCKSCKLHRFPTASSSAIKMADATTDNDNHVPEKSQLDTIQATLLTLTAKVDKLTAMENNIRELQKSITYVSNSFDDFAKQLQSLRNENKDLKDKLANTTKEVNELHQYTRRNTLEISGIPEDGNEDTDNIVVKVAEIVGVNVSPDDIDISHRLPQRPSRQSNGQRKPATIIVKFVRRSLRNKLYSSRKNLKGKTTRNIGVTSNNRIYINENLTSTNKQLFFQVNQLRNEKHWKFIWTHNGKIYVRKNVGDPAIIVATIRDLDRIV
ncbi:uncharacterized protein LOC144433778 [Glandiceps talaboti]